MRISIFLIHLSFLALSGILEAQEAPKADPSREKPHGEKSEEIEKKDKPATEEKKEPKEEKSGISAHEIEISGEPIGYEAKAGHLILKKADGSPRAKVFYTAYRLKTVNGAAPEGLAKRPVCFCFNGGPGSSAIWLHMGAFGPKRVDLPADGVTPAQPPFKLTPNAHSLLDAADLVFIDPVSTGYSRAEKLEESKQFHGIQEDIESVGDFIRRYVHEQNLWDNPKFLMGESYGGIRAAGLASHLQTRFGLWLNGLIIVSGVLDFQTLLTSGTNDLPYICFLPSMASVAHYHKKLSPERQADFQKTFREAEEFAHGTYATALLKGALPEEERQSLASQISSLIGLPADYILRSNLRVSPSRFYGKLLEAENKQIGRFDARVIGEAGAGDPSYSLVYGPYASTFYEYVRSELNYDSEQPYEILTGAVQPWNYSGFTNSYVSVAEDLGDALKQNPALRVYIACGYHDLATPMHAIKHSINHLEISPKLRSQVRYGYFEGGHMMYTTVSQLEALSKEVRGFLRE
jgi:carboxypeptidase C (cathepsin A)